MSNSEVLLKTLTILLEIEFEVTIRNVQNNVMSVTQLCKSVLDNEVGGSRFVNLCLITK